MNLRDYLKKKGISVKKFALTAEIPWSSLYRNLRGTPMDPKRALKVEQMTDKEVTKEESMHINE